jgi:hypothetical protein
MINQAKTERYNHSLSIEGAMILIEKFLKTEVRDNHKKVREIKLLPSLYIPDKWDVIIYEENRWGSDIS